MSAIELLAYAQPATLRRGVAAEATHLRDSIREASLPLPVTVAVSTWLSLVIHLAGGETH